MHWWLTCNVLMKQKIIFRAILVCFSFENIKIVIKSTLKTHCSIIKSVNVFDVSFLNMRDILRVARPSVPPAGFKKHGLLLKQISIC